MQCRGLKMIPTGKVTCCATEEDLRRRSRIINYYRHRHDFFLQYNIPISHLYVPPLTAAKYLFLLYFTPLSTIRTTISRLSGASRLRNHHYECNTFRRRSERFYISRRSMHQASGDIAHCKATRKPCKYIQSSHMRILLTISQGFLRSQLQHRTSTIQPAPHPDLPHRLPSMLWLRDIC